MLKKLFIAVAVGALLSPVGLALSSTGGKGLGPRGGTSQCSKKARAAGGTHQSCVVTVRTTITKYKTVYRPVTTTKTTDHTTTSTKSQTYTRTTTVGGDGSTTTSTVTRFFTVPGHTFTALGGTQTVTQTAPGSTFTTQSTATDHVTTTQTETVTTTSTITVNTFGDI
jgi:hypothetical protein